MSVMPPTSMTSPDASAARSSIEAIRLPSRTTSRLPASISWPSNIRAFVKTSITTSSIYSEVRPRYSEVRPRYSEREVRPRYSEVRPRYSEVRPRYSEVRPRWLKRQSGGKRSSLSRTKLVRPRSSASRSSSCDTASGFSNRPVDSSRPERMLPMYSP